MKYKVVTTKYDNIYSIYGKGWFFWNYVDSFACYNEENLVDLANERIEEYKRKRRTVKEFEV